MNKNDYRRAFVDGRGLVRDFVGFIHLIVLVLNFFSHLSDLLAYLHHHQHQNFMQTVDTPNHQYPSSYTHLFGTPGLVRT